MNLSRFHPLKWELPIGNAKETPNARFDYIQPYIEGATVLDIGVVQHDIDSTERDMWLHGLIADRAAYCKGIDIDEEGVEYLEEEGYDVELADAESFELGESFDVIVAGEIIEHLSNVGRFLDSVGAHLDENGVFIVTTPNPFYWGRFRDILLFGDKPVNPEHTCWFDSDTLEQVLDRHGFEVEELHFTSQEWLYRNIPIPRAELRNTGMVAIARKRLSTGTS